MGSGLKNSGRKFVQAAIEETQLGKKEGIRGRMH